MIQSFHDADYRLQCYRIKADKSTYVLLLDFGIYIYYAFFVYDDIINLRSQMRLCLLRYQLFHAPDELLMADVNSHNLFLIVIRNFDFLVDLMNVYVFMLQYGAIKIRKINISIK